MMSFKNYCIAFLMMSSVAIFSQKKYPTHYFRKPLDIPIFLAGTFGELRNNHFHSGMDIKTGGKEGLKVYAAADGYVSRIRVALWGYGKSIYITHPNGYTTVYAHLSKYGKGIQEFVKSIQYKKQSYETGNIFLKPGQFPVKKGQIIAFSGSTGGFIAPHLHFEIRNTKTEKIINPMLFGIVPDDTIHPRVKGVFAYVLTDSSRINQSNKNSLLSFKKIAPNTFTTGVITANGKIGFGIQVYDQLNKSYNKNGIYSLDMYVNGAKKYHHDLETFSFANSKYLNLLIDYYHYAKYKTRFQRLFKTPHNKLNIYKNLVNNGELTIKNGFSYNVAIVASDFKGNTTTVKIPVKGVKNNPIFKQAKDTTAYKIIAIKFEKFTQKGVTIAFPKNTFYNDVYLDFKVKNNIAHIHSPTIPLDKNFTLTFDVSKYSKTEKEQLYIANINNKKYPNYQYTRKKDSFFYTTTKTLGNYTLIIDNQKPVIKLKNFYSGKWMTKSKTLVVQIYDNNSGINSYRATIDGKWVLMEYDVKKKQIVYDFSDNKLTGTKHQFTIEVLDNVGNTNLLHATFYKKQ